MSAAPLIPGVSTPQPALRPAGAGSVMASHAPALVSTDSALVALYRRLEYFPTPPWAFRALGERLAVLDPGAWSWWESACGEGHGAHGLRDYADAVLCSDIHDYGAGLVHDFLSGEDGVGAMSPALDGFHADWVATNPPFGKAAEFVRVGLSRARRGVALLCRSGWRDTGGRHGLFHGGDGSGKVGRALAGLPPCDLELPFYDRVPMNLGRWVVRASEPGGSSATPYSWFIWFQDGARPPALDAARAAMAGLLPMCGADGRALSGPRALPAIGIPPGTKERLTGADDARLFGWREGGADLLSGVGVP